MSAVDYLKTARDGEKPTSKEEASSPSSDPDESNSTSRIIKLSDDEQKQFSEAKPGEELECVVRGNLEEDGHFHVMSVSAPGGKGYGDDASGGGMSSEEQMAQKVATLVQPRLQISPS